jgi:hypothetical protein
MAPWTSVAAYKQGEKFSFYPTTNMKLKTSGHWVVTQIGADVTATLV